MDISRLMVFAQQIDESTTKRKNREMKRARSDEKGQPRFKKRAFNQDSSSTPGLTKSKVVGPYFLNLVAPIVERSIMGSA